jgi:acyl-CoA hydrolase
MMSMGQTGLKSTQLMHIQDKNLSGKIFGGFIMRLAF